MTKSPHNPWQKHGGGPCPFSDNIIVEVLLSKKIIIRGYAWDDFRWAYVEQYRIAIPQNKDSQYLSPFDKEYHCPKTTEALSKQVMGLVERVSDLEKWQKAHERDNAHIPTREAMENNA